jgi:hypothetical protein
MRGPRSYNDERTWWAFATFVVKNEAALVTALWTKIKVPDLTSRKGDLSLR